MNQHTTTQPNRIIIGISGASGFQYGYKAIELLDKIRPFNPNLEIHLVISKGAQLTRTHETPNLSIEKLHSMADFSHAIGNLGAPIASGSFQTNGMLIAPCSMRTLSAVAFAMSDNLLTRTADVMLKERRKLVLMVRETPLNLAHLDNMKRVTEMGGVIFPPVPALYHNPKSVDELIELSVGRALGLLGLNIPDFPQWLGRID